MLAIVSWRQLGAQGAFQMGLDVADRHPARIQADDHVAQPADPALPLRHQPRVEAAVAVPRRGQIEVADLGAQPLRGDPVPGVARPVPGRVMLLIAQMIGQLRLQPGLQHPLHQLRQEPALPGQLHPALIDPVHQLVQEPPVEEPIHRLLRRPLRTIRLRHAVHPCASLPTKRLHRQPDTPRESDPLRLADLAKGKMRRKIPDLAQALTGHFDANHARLARSMLRRLDLVEQAMAELDAVIVDACRPWQHQIELLQTIPGVGPKVAETIIAETGADMSRFPTAAHLAAWAGLAPAMNESAGRQTPAGKRHGNKWLTAMLVEAAGSVGRMHGKNYLAAQHARLTKRRGMGRAQVAVAHSILVAAYWMLKRDEPYHDLGADWHSRRNDEAHTRRLIAQLEHLGHTVIIDPAA